MVCEPSKTTLHVSFQPNQTTPTSETKVSIHQIKSQPLPICPRAIGQANRSHVDINGIITQIPTCVTQAKLLLHIRRSLFLKGTSEDLFFLKGTSEDQRLLCTVLSLMLSSNFSTSK